MSADILNHPSCSYVQVVLDTFETFMQAEEADDVKLTVHMKRSSGHPVLEIEMNRLGTGTL